MNLELFFRIISYAAVFCGFLALWVSGGFGIVGSVIFPVVMIAAWRLEGSRWQIGEKLGTTLIVLALPTFFLAWRFQIISFGTNEAAVAGVLSQMILSLSAVKLLQRKSDRDWIFLYLMSFFEVLLAAGLSISAMYLGVFLLFLLTMVCAVIAFEIRKTARSVEFRSQGLAEIKGDTSSEAVPSLKMGHVPRAALFLVLLIVIIALPFFFMLPRVGGAGIGSGQSGLSTSAGFSDTVKLGGIGRIQQDDAIVMRVKIEAEERATSDLYFRGIAFDTFDNQSWSRSKSSTREPFIRSERSLIQIDDPGPQSKLMTQTIYLEPLETNLIFGMPRILAVSGNFPIIYRDNYGAISYQRGLERITYKIVSDTYKVPVPKLLADNGAYSEEYQNYRSLPPRLDPRISELTSQVTSRLIGRYEKAREIESYLQNNFAYTLEQKAGGDQPLADFLFNIKAGHCEYFATAMAVMLRTQGMATRVVNGFHSGDYNETADVFVVRQRNAHAWVEVYFPGEKTWVRFDPTPAAGVPGGVETAGVSALFSKYFEALETFWIQYFVAFDDQEQRSLIKNLRTGITETGSDVSAYLRYLQNVLVDWWLQVRGDQGIRASVSAIANGAVWVGSGLFSIVLCFLLLRRFKKSGLWRKLRSRTFSEGANRTVEFYERLIALLKLSGFERMPHQTPLEFASSIGIPEAVTLTEKYHFVRFGDITITATDETEIDKMLKKIEVAYRNERSKA